MSSRVALVGLPGLLADVVAGAFQPQDAVSIEVLAGESALDVPAAGGTPGPDVIIAGVEDPWQTGLTRRLLAQRDLVLIGVRADGRDAWVYELQPHPVRLGQLSPAVLRAAVLAGLDRRPAAGP